MWFPFSDSSLLYVLHQNKSWQLHFSWGKGGGFFFLNSYTLVKSLKQAELCKAVLRLIRQESARWHSHPCERRTNQLLKSVFAGAWSSSHLFMSAVLTQEQEMHPVLTQQQLLWKSEGRVWAQLFFIHQDLNYCEFFSSKTSIKTDQKALRFVPVDFPYTSSGEIMAIQDSAKSKAWDTNVTWRIYISIYLVLQWK